MPKSDDPPPPKRRGVPNEPAEGLTDQQWHDYLDHLDKMENTGAFDGGAAMTPAELGFAAEEEKTPDGKKPDGPARPYRDRTRPPKRSER